MLLPRPKWVRSGFNAKKAFMTTVFGMWLRRALLTWNGFLIVREVWYFHFSPGSFRATLRSLWKTITKGEAFAWPEKKRKVFSGDVSRGAAAAAALSDPLSWYVTTADLEFCRDAIERDVGPSWERMFEKHWDGCTYTAFRRSLPNGKTEYKSTTIYENSTAQEFMDFYLDDDMRPKWDGMISEHQLLESAHDTKHRCQVVRWVRSFPFAFISRREYVIARRMFRLSEDLKMGSGETLYGITKGIDHPAAPRCSDLVRMSTFYSMWRSRTVPCPKGSDNPACETTLLHFEDFGIPENLARFAVRKGMAGFVSKMVPYVGIFVKERRLRCSPFEDDKEAYGAGLVPVMNGSESPSCILSPSPSISTEDGFVEECDTDMAGKPPQRSSSRRGLSYMIVASGVALALSKVGSVNSLDNLVNENNLKSPHSHEHRNSEISKTRRLHHHHGLGHVHHHSIHRRHGHGHQHRMHGLHAHRRSKHYHAGLKSHRIGKSPNGADLAHE